MHSEEHFPRYLDSEKNLPTFIFQASGCAPSIWNVLNACTYFDNQPKP